MIQYGYIVSELKDFISNKKNIISLLLFGIVALALPLITNLVQKQQILKSQAANPPIEFKGPNVKDLDGEKVFTLGVGVSGSATVSLTITPP